MQCIVDNVDALSAFRQSTSLVVDKVMNPQGPSGGPGAVVSHSHQLAGILNHLIHSIARDIPCQRKVPPSRLRQ